MISLGGCYPRCSRPNGVQSPVYKVKPQSGGGRITVLHRNLLLPCDAVELDASKPAFGARPRKTAAEKTPLSVSGNGLQSSGEEDHDFVSLDLVAEISSEDKDLPSDSVENHATTEGTNGTSDQTEPTNERVLKMMKRNYQGESALLSRIYRLGRSVKEDRRRS